MIARLVVLIVVVAASAASPPPRTTILAELFTSEGCASCPAADALLAHLAREQPFDGVEVIPVGLHVDYFNHLGWKDAFSSSAFTHRQQEYSAVFGPDNMYTPQLVVDGREAVPGNDADQVRRAIDAALRRPHLPMQVAARATGDHARLTLDLPAAPATGEPLYVVAAITEDDLTTVVTHGENQGRTLHHVAVTRTLRRVAALAPQPSTVRVDLAMKRSWAPAALKAVAWLEGGTSRGVYGAATARLTP